MGHADVVWRKQDSIPSSPHCAVELIRTALDQLEAYKWSDKQVFGIHVALEEALMNAIKHGNQGDESKLVAIEFELTESQFQAQITDEGNGFTMSNIPDPTQDDNLELPTGRGMAMIRNFVDEVKYNEKGNSLIIVAHRT